MSLNHRLAEDDPNRNSIQWQAERELLPPFLVVDYIAELWAKGTKFSKESYVGVLKEDIEDGKLACMTKGQWIALSEKSRKRLSHRRPPPVSGFEFVSYLTTDTDLVPEDRRGGCLGDTSGMSDHDKKMAARLYMVNRIEFKKWLQENDEWPLPEECLLARWWDSDKGDEEANALQTAATKYKEKAIQVLINRVVQANPEASNVEIWNKLKDYDSEKIIQEQIPESIKSIKGNEKASIAWKYHDYEIKTTKEYTIKLKAFQERCTKARKELGLNSKTC